MRDRNLDLGYFNKALEKRKRFIQSFESKIASNEKANRNPMRFYSLRSWYYEEFLIEYSMGLNEFSFNWENYFNAFLNMSKDVGNYYDVLQATSLGILFGATTEQFSQLKDWAVSRREYDDVLKSFCFGQNSNETSQIRAIIPENNDLIRAIETNETQFLKNYLSNWYKSNEDEYWHGQHKEPEGLEYCGYWCIEAAAAVKKFNIPYDSIRNHKYFPVDMVEM